MSLSQKVFDWTYFGTAYATHETEKRHIIFSNIVFLTLPIVYLVFILIDIKSFFDLREESLANNNCNDLPTVRSGRILKFK